MFSVVSALLLGEKQTHQPFPCFTFINMASLIFVSSFFFFFGATSLRSAVLLVISVLALPLDVVEEAVYVSGGLCPTFEPH